MFFVFNIHVDICFVFGVNYVHSRGLILVVLLQYVISLCKLVDHKTWFVVENTAAKQHVCQLVLCFVPRDHSRMEQQFDNRIIVIVSLLGLCLCLWFLFFSLIEKAKVSHRTAMEIKSDVVLQMEIKTNKITKGVVCKRR